MHRDDDVRASCFASLDVLCATFGDDVPYLDGLDAGFAFRGGRMPFLSHAEGDLPRGGSARAGRALESTHRRARRTTDEPVDDGFRLRLPRRLDRSARQSRTAPGARSPGAARLLRRAPGPVGTSRSTPLRCRGRSDLRIVLVCRPAGRSVRYDELDRSDPTSRSSAVRRSRDTRPSAPGALPRTRARRLPRSCTICRLKESRLLDAAHIVADAEPTGEPPSRTD